MQQTPIGWTDFSTNLLKYLNADGKTVWACVHASEGCRFCYSEVLAKRWGRGAAFTAENIKSLTPYFDTAEASQILKSKKIACKKVFVDDMTDLFGEWVSEEIIRAHFAVFAARPDVTFQILTKRAKRVCQILTEWEREGLTLRGGRGAVLPNVHIGVSVEDQQQADSRIAELVNTPAAVRWLSVEPLIEDVSLRWGVWEQFKQEPGCVNDQYDGLRLLDGIVIGGESGARHREMPLQSAIKLARDAKAAGLAVYVKQDSGPRPGTQGRIPDDIWAMKEWPTHRNDQWFRKQRLML